MVIEQVLSDMSNAEHIKYIALRYFNVAGADRDLKIGKGKEDATHLITMCVRTALGLRNNFIFTAQIILPTMAQE